MESKLPAVRLLVSGDHGQYVPQTLSRMYDLSLWSGIDPDNVKIIEQGPDHEHYDEAWSEILDSASYTHDGNTWTLWQDGDLWAVCDELMDDQEYEDFWGEVRP